MHICTIETGLFATKTEETMYKQNGKTMRKKRLHVYMYMYSNSNYGAVVSRIVHLTLHW